MRTAVTSLIHSYCLQLTTRLVPKTLLSTPVTPCQVLAIHLIDSSRESCDEWLAEELRPESVSTHPLVTAFPTRMLSLRIVSCRSLKQP
ncbi:unnamed protein product [Oppiella nova]|uniref:Uncharacterized protein n=1 Tax=Oppiella nova TaxID=334625 RepID=A0A7R9M6R1_9ACAR|nr:unnamed protein product [Oppiella nova]CAG2171278.1 unnamed protein product [Oppiella nova]